MPQTLIIAATANTAYPLAPKQCIAYSIQFVARRNTNAFDDANKNQGRVAIGHGTDNNNQPQAFQPLVFPAGVAGSGDAERTLMGTSRQGFDLSKLFLVAETAGDGIVFVYE